MSDTQNVVDTIAKYRNRGWLPGGNGALALLCSITENSKKIYITPSNINQLKPSDLFMLRDTYGAQDVQLPINKEGGGMTEWAPLFMHIFQTYPDSKAVAQVATKWTSLAARASLISWKKSANNFPNIFRISHWPALKKIINKTDLEIPIVNYGDNKIAEGIAMLSVYPNTFALLIRDYGAIIWGDSLHDVEAKIEILEHLCELQIYSYSLLSGTEL
jgi:ribulose-5-phosphate 4-epimerase/fuculose-1-phosphate aldolase